MPLRPAGKRAQLGQQLHGEFGHLRRTEQERKAGAALVDNLDLDGIQGLVGGHRDVGGLDQGGLDQGRIDRLMHRARPPLSADGHRVHIWCRRAPGHALHATRRSDLPSSDFSAISIS
jgi:hypothetical protein